MKQPAEQPAQSKPKFAINDYVEAHTGVRYYIAKQEKSSTGRWMYRMSAMPLPNCIGILNLWYSELQLELIKRASAQTQAKKG